MTFFGVVAIEEAKRDSYRYFYEFIDDYCHFERLVLKMRNYMSQILYI